MSHSVRRTTIALILTFSAVVFFARPSWADDASAKLYQGKCAACHAADGSGSTIVGKALHIKDLRDPEVQKESDADLTNLVAKGKDKMPAFEKTLKPADIKGLIAYVRELGKKS